MSSSSVPGVARNPRRLPPLLLPPAACWPTGHTRCHAPRRQVLRASRPETLPPSQSVTRRQPRREDVPQIPLHPNLLAAFTLIDQAKFTFSTIPSLPSDKLQWLQRERLPSRLRKATPRWRRRTLRRLSGGTRENETG